MFTLATLVPGAALAQAGTPAVNPSAIARVRTRPDVMAANARLQKAVSSRRVLLRRLGFEDGLVCTAPTPISAADLDIHRSLFVHDVATLGAGDFSLRRTLTKLRDDVAASVPGLTPEAIFRQFMDSQNDTPAAVTTGNPLCSDGGGKVNGFPFNNCPRPEGAEAAGTDADVAARIDHDYRPIALVNRFDLADKGWRNCGEHRIVYGKVDGIAKNLIIFEAVLPNPRPGCRSGCREVIDFWTGLSSDPSPASRAAKLETFYYGGLPGFSPVVMTNHYTSGTSSSYGGSTSGQIRTNQFLNRSGLGLGPWTLKEFKTFLSCAGGTCDFDILPVAVKVNPYGVLWNRDVATGTVPPLPPDNGYATPIVNLQALAAAFQGDVQAQVTAARLANPDVNSITYEVAPDKNSAESQSHRPVIDHYPSQFANAADATFRTNLDTLAAGFGLTGAQIVNRATASSCAGCHLPGGFGLTQPSSIGPGVSWPDALSFVHVDVENVSLASQPEFDPANFGGNVNGFNISPALLDVFLPARENVLATNANQPICDCVPKLGVLTPKPLATQLQAIRESSSRLEKELAEAQKRFDARERVSSDDARKLLEEKKGIMNRVQAARDAALAQLGVTTKPVAPKAEPVNLGATQLAQEKLRVLKGQKLREIVQAEPPRETVTGSFRPH
ncbi:MAG TPA: hypothetical protein VEA99_00375 [Gemmatimonadaceae bacterium]|nr:hypothetical protein [Gemmatimonadaceae bacterium]